MHFQFLFRYPERIEHDGGWEWYLDSTRCNVCKASICWMLVCHQPPTCFFHKLKIFFIISLSLLRTLRPRCYELIRLVRMLRSRSDLAPHAHGSRVYFCQWENPENQSPACSRKKTICLTTMYLPDKEKNIQTVTEHASFNHNLSLHVLWVKLSVLGNFSIQCITNWWIELYCNWSWVSTIKILQHTMDWL